MCYQFYYYQVFIVHKNLKIQCKNINFCEILRMKLHINLYQLQHIKPKFHALDTHTRARAHTHTHTHTHKQMHVVSAYTFRQTGAILMDVKLVLS